MTGFALFVVIPMRFRSIQKGKGPGGNMVIRWIGRNPYEIQVNTKQVRELEKQKSALWS